MLLLVYYHSLACHCWCTDLLLHCVALPTCQGVALMEQGDWKGAASTFSRAISVLSMEAPAGAVQKRRVGGRQSGRVCTCACVHTCAHVLLLLCMLLWVVHAARVCRTLSFLLVCVGEGVEGGCWLVFLWMAGRLVVITL